MDLALNNQQRLICHKTQTNRQIKWQHDFRKIFVLYIFKFDVCNSDNSSSGSVVYLRIINICCTG